MARIIKVGKWLDCGCCGEDFQVWDGYVDQDQDDGYGICQSCQEDIQERNDAEIDKIVVEISKGLSPESRENYLAKPIEEQREFALACLHKGFVKMTFVAN